MGERPTKTEVLRVLAQELPYLRERFGVTRMALYGSITQEKATSQSDVDLLVELSRPLGLEFVALAQYLEGRLRRRVDLATFETLRRSLRHPRCRNVAERIAGTLTDVETAA